MILSEKDIVKDRHRLFSQKIRNLCITNAWLQWALFPGISVASYILVEEPGQTEEPKEIFLAQFEFNL